jgi:hypothetical protein
MSADTATPPILLSLSQTAVIVGASVNRLRRAVLRGEVVPVARAGDAVNAPICFTVDQLPDIQRALTADADTGSE